jgi:hypothetical protein
MTFDERVAALAPLGFTPRQTRFLVTAALHSGYCLRRQYLAFLDIGLGHAHAVLAQNSSNHFSDNVVVTSIHGCR